MKYKQLGRSGLLVSELCLGTMTFGGKGFWSSMGALGQSSVDQIVKGTYEAGINFIDTADVYSEGESELLLGQALKNTGIARKDVVIALGGGVIGDLTGFACAVYMRGVDFIQIPTTVLAQVDSSVGGKTAIDHERGKNLIGAFWQPRLVLCDLDVLATLPAREIRCGYAEIIKYGLLGDRAFFEWLEANDDKVLALEPQALQHAIARSVEMKADIVAQDEREGGVRALLNLGHTFGHALETAGHYTTLLHGEGVAIGMLLAAQLSERLGMSVSADTSRLRHTLEKLGLPTTIPPGMDAQQLLALMRLDKKNTAGALRLILWRGIGRAEIVGGVDEADVLAVLQAAA